ncbi:rho guanine nucleotide exchange factor 1 isoform X3 [Notothenia coriiceps]|uniref:Rho guanine nucleotide exchange factor 1 isoform X3 n=1 Tax=Notothenia coriiceps TaxID=8208 RepID=A0A6I9P1Q6_9TELE|nr:PREDICTED: rho guanine nucleotide exchange factor 1 isoform X3 [Notothenia coriiceps]
MLLKKNRPTIVMDEEKCQSIFSAVAYYMKHLGVKTRAVDSKKSRGGFFRSKLVKNKRDESSKAKPRGVFPGIPSWIAGNTEKEKVNPERKGLGPGRGSVTDSAMPSAPSRKSVSTGSPSSLPGLEVNDGSGNNVSIINNPESSHGDGLSSNRLEPPCQSEGGDVSPVGLGGGLIVGEPLSPMDTSTEDNVEKER